MDSNCPYCDSPEKYGVLPAELLLVHRGICDVWELGQRREETIKAHRPAHPISAIPDFYIECQKGGQ